MHIDATPKVGELVLALVGKHSWWPALVQGESDDATDAKRLSLYFFGDHSATTYTDTSTYTNSDTHSQKLKLLQIRSRMLIMIQILICLFGKYRVHWNKYKVRGK